MNAHDEAAPSAQNLAERIRHLANGRSTLDVAQFQFIGLAEIRAGYGDAWPAKRERVNTIARHFISKRIRSDDLLIPGADGFLLVYSFKPGFAADQAAMRIAKDLNAFFIGSGPEDSDVRIGAQHSVMDVEDLGATLEKSDAASIIAAQAAEKALNPEPAGRLQMRYQPKWDARREALTHNLLTPIHPNTGRPVPGYRFDGDADTQRSFAHLDQLQLKASEEAMRTAFAAGRRALMSVSVHITSLQNGAGLSRLIPVMNDFDKDLARYRVIRIAGIEAGFPRGALGDITRMLKVRVQQISFALNLHDPDIMSAIRLQPSAIGFPLTAEWLAGPRAELLGRIRTVAELARLHQTPVFVEGDITAELARQLVAVGVDRIASPLIWPRTVEPQGAEKWSLTKLDENATIIAA